MPYYWFMLNPQRTRPLRPAHFSATQPESMRALCRGHVVLSSISINYLASMLTTQVFSPVYLLRGNAMCISVLENLQTLHI